MKNPMKALEAIERIVGSDFGMDMEFYYMDKPEWNKVQLKKNLRLAAKLITQIYRIAHADTLHACSHSNWEKEKYEILKQPDL